MIGETRGSCRLPRNCTFQLRWFIFEACKYGYSVKIQYTVKIIFCPSNTLPENIDFSTNNAVLLHTHKFLFAKYHSKSTLVYCSCTWKKIRVTLWTPPKRLVGLSSDISIVMSTQCLFMRIYNYLVFLLYFSLFTFPIL